MNNPKILKCDLAVVGGGAAGMIAACTAAEALGSVFLIERNKKLGKKLSITGKGRCNVTNNCTISEFIDAVTVNKKFLYSAVNSFSPQDTISFFEGNGVRLKTERGKRVFPVSDKSSDIVNCLERLVKKSGCKILNSKVIKINTDNNRVVSLLLDNGTLLHCRKIILACGGVSYPQTGSDGSGFALAKQVGHRITDLKPSLVPLVSPDNDCKSLQGLSLRNVKIDVVDNDTKKVVFSDFGEMLFTHFGLSGPIILSASSHMRKKDKLNYIVSIDLKPALTRDQLDKRVLRDFLQNSNKCFINSLNKLLPNKLISVIIKRVGINPYCKCNSITKKQRLFLVDTLKNLTFDITAFRPIEEAIITSGGVDTKQINPKTMMSKLTDGLYFAGEIIDVDAYTGGFNLQIAFSTGYLAAKSCIRECEL